MKVDLAERMRAAFDASFELADADAERARELLIAIRVGAARYALRPAEVAAIFRAPPITPLPGSVPGRVGLAVVQGSLVPVYSLASLLGATPEPVAWLAICRLPSPVGLGFPELQGSIDVAPSQVSAERAVGRHVVAAVDEPSGKRFVLDVASVVSEIADACRAASRED